VTIEGNRVAHAKSFIGKSTGNEVAKNTGGGIITHVVQGEAHFQTYSRNVFVEGEPMVGHGHLLTHNQKGPMPANTPPTPWMSTMLAGPGPAPKELEKQVGKKKGWIKIRVVDQDGHPAAGVGYCVTTPDGKKIEGHLFRGAGLTLRGCDEGACTVEFETTPAAPGQAKGKSKEGQPYKDAPMRLATGKDHLVQIAIPRVLCIDLPIDPADPQYASHGFILRSKDGSYESKRTIADDAFPGDRKLSLEFADLVPGKTYTLFHDNGEETVGIFFADRSYEDLFPPPSERRFLRPKGSQTAARDPMMSTDYGLRLEKDDRLLEIEPQQPNDPDAGPDAGDDR
jgi:hypothetical protein